MRPSLAELSRRGVFKTLLAYMVAAWVIVEVVSVIASAFLLPPWTVAVATTIAVLGTFPVLFLSWRYEISADGIRRDEGHASAETDRHARWLSVGLVAVLVGITTALWINYFRAHSGHEIEALQQAQQGAPEIGEDGVIRSIAVLPFEDFTPGHEKRLLADGIPEAILHTLAQNEDLLVTARTSSFAFRDRNVTASEIGRILNVEALLEGSVQISGNRLRVTSQLIATADQNHIWSNVYEAELEDIFEIQDAIANTVRDLIVEKSGAQVAALPEPASYPSLEAYELLLEAKSLLDEQSLADAERAASLLRLAIEISPEYADAHAWLTLALNAQAVIRIEQRSETWSSMGDLWTEMEVATARALELDPNNAIAILQQGQLSQGSGGQGYHEAREKALAVAPNDPTVLSWVATLDAQQLDFQSARIHLRRAARVDPGDFSILAGYISLFCGRENLGSMVEARLRDHSASAATAIRLKSQASLCDGRYADAMMTLARLIRIDPEPASALLALQLLANLADEDALKLVDEAHKLVPGEFSESPTFFGVEDLSVYFPSLTSDRIRTFRWHARNGANPYFFMTTFALLQIQADNLSGAANSLAFAQTIWDDYYAFRGEHVMSTDTIAIYALRAWVSKQMGDDRAAGPGASQLLAALQRQGLDRWSESRDQLHHFPLLILLLNDKQDQALQWLRSAADDRWLGFQAVLTSPIYAEFREIPEVTAVLEQLAVWRGGVLAELRVPALQEAYEPSLLLAKIRSIIPPSDHHLAKIAFGVDRDYQAAAGHFENALAEGALDSDLLGDALRFAYTLGRFEKATLLAEIAVDRRPDDYRTHYELGFSHFWARRWAKAIESFENARQVDPDATSLIRWIGISKILLGDPVGGMENVQELPDGWPRLVGLAIAYHAMGQNQESDAALAELKEKHGVWGAFNIAYVLAYRGETDESFEWLQKAVDYNNRGLWSVSFHPLFNNIHDDPRWERLMRDLGVAREQVAGVEFSFKPSS